MNKIKKILLISILIVFTLNLQASYIKTIKNDYVIYDVKAKYSDISFTLLDEIEQNGFIFSYRAKIGNALKKISKHYNKKPIFKKAEKIGFCKLSLSLEMMEENPNNLMFCPLSIAMYELKDKKNEVRIIYRLSQNLEKDGKVGKVMNKVNTLILKMIEESIE